MKIVVPYLASLSLALLAGWSVHYASTLRPEPMIANQTSAPASTKPKSTTQQESSTQRQPRAQILVAEILARPIFEISRRPLEIAPPSQTQPELQAETEPEPVIEAEIAEPVPEEIVVQPQEVIVPTPQLQLLGVFSNDARVSALLAVNQTEPTWYRLGDVVEGWELSDVTSDSATLIEGDRKLEIKLYRK